MTLALSLVALVACGAGGFRAYEGLPHGFGIGTETVAEGWIDDAVAFWEAQRQAPSP